MTRTGSIVHRRRQPGFSLVELLVVLGVVVILLALLMPALTKVRRQANSTVCKSNLRQCGAMLQMYAMNNRGWLFPVGLGSNVPRERRWPTLVFSPPVWNPRVMLCPDDDSPEEEHSYLLNRHLADKGIRFGKKTPLPSDRVAVMGEKVSTRPDYYMEFVDDESEFFAVVELYRHGTVLGSNYLYFDGHVDSAAPKRGASAVDPWDVSDDVGPSDEPPAGGGGEGAAQ